MLKMQISCYNLANMLSEKIGRNEFFSMKELNVLLAVIHMGLHVANNVSRELTNIH